MWPGLVRKPSDFILSFKCRPHKNMQHLREICERAKVAGAMQNYANAAPTAPRWAWRQLQSHLRFMQRNLPNVKRSGEHGAVAVDFGSHAADSSTVGSAKSHKRGANSVEPHTKNIQKQISALELKTNAFAL